MTENYLFNKRQEKPQRNGLIMVLLFLSFVWISLFTATSSYTNALYFNFGNILDTTSQNFSTMVFIIISEATIGLLGFEFIFFIYRKILQSIRLLFLLTDLKRKAEFFIFIGIFFMGCF